MRTLVLALGALLIAGRAAGSQNLMPTEGTEPGLPAPAAAVSREALAAGVRRGGMPGRAGRDQTAPPVAPARRKNHPVLGAAIGATVGAIVGAQVAAAAYDRRSGHLLTRGSEMRLGAICGGVIGLVLGAVAGALVWTGPAT